MAPSSLAAAPEEGLIGTVLLGKYRVHGVLGRGGMGVVLDAEHETLRQPVAIKLMRADGMLVDPEGIARFEREGQAIARLQDEHVARIFDAGRLPDGRHYMVMERLEGVDLSILVRVGRSLAPGVVAEYVRQACLGIAAVHAAGIVHRDLKPKNLFLVRAASGRPVVKVLDFGISKMSAEAASLTSSGHVLGTPRYMSPEQLRSARDADVRTDIWALGVVLYELLASRSPFDAGSVAELIAIVLTQEPRPLREIRPDLPLALTAIVDRCLAKEPAARFASAAELEGALAPVSVVEPLPDRWRELLAVEGPASPRVVEGWTTTAPAATDGRVGGGVAPSPSHGRAPTLPSAPEGATGPRGVRIGRAPLLYSMMAALAVVAVGGWLLASKLGNRSGSTPVTSATEPLASGRATGLADPANDPALNAFADGIKQCRFAEGVGFSGYGPCEPLESLKKRAKESARTRTTMLNWIEDESPPIRAAAAGILWTGGSTDKPFASCDGGARVKAALYREVLRYTGWELALAWHQFVRFCPAQDAEMQTFVKDTTFPLLMARQELVPRLAADVIDRAGWYETLVDVLASEQQDAKVRQGVPKALARVSDGKRGAAARVIRPFLGGTDPELAASSAEALASLKIDDAFPAILDAARADLAAGAKHSHFFYAMASYTGRPDARIDRPGAFKLAEACATSPAASAGSRIAALNVLERGKAPGWQRTAQAIAAKTPPDDKLVVEHAQRLLAQATPAAP